MKVSGVGTTRAGLEKAAADAVEAAERALDAEAQEIMAAVRLGLPAKAGPDRVRAENTGRLLERRIVILGPLARYLEFGTRRRPARPVLLPALLSALPALRTRLTTALGRAFSEKRL